MHKISKAAGAVALCLWAIWAPAAAADDAQVRISVTSGGQDANGKARFELHAAGKHDGPVIGWSGTGQALRVPAGNYDAQIIFEDGAAHKSVWLDGLAVSGKLEKTVDLGIKVASITYHLTNNGADTDKARVEIHAAGNHGGPVIIWSTSGREMRLPEGSYDTEVIFEDGAANKTLWLDAQSFTGKVDKTVEIGVKVASVTYHLTNNGADEYKARVEIRAAGKHDGPLVAWSTSGREMRMPDGNYDAEVIFQDGAANKTMWIDNQSFAGKVEKTVDLATKVASVTYRLLNNGEDITNKSRVEIHPSGAHGGPLVAWSVSGGEMRMPEASYDVAVIFAAGQVHKTIWIDNQAFAGRVDRTVDLSLKLAEPLVTATLNGADVGDKARIGFLPAGKTEEAGAIRSGERALLEAGTYDLVATMPGAEGWLRKTEIAGKQQLSMALQTFKTAELKSGGPPPKACTIEVYGVNFDFDKAVLRTDSESVLRAILRLFTATPAFSAEVGGHTDNIGKPDYNLKLSEARAAAVKTWLLAHGVAQARVNSHGYGDTRPLVENDTDANRFKNRRVELRRPNCR